MKRVGVKTNIADDLFLFLLFFQTYTIQDEHSAPFSWRTRSQQDLNFEAGAPDQEEDSGGDSSGLPHEEEGTTLLSSPSRILTNNSTNNKMASATAARYSRGNPSFAKAVQIPRVCSYN